jgi:hypothetical protein
MPLRPRSPGQGKATEAPWVDPDQGRFARHVRQGVIRTARHSASNTARCELINEQHRHRGRLASRAPSKEKGRWRCAVIFFVPLTH